MSRIGDGSEEDGRTCVHFRLSERARAQAAALREAGYDVNLGVEGMLEQACRELGVDVTM